MNFNILSKRLSFGNTPAGKIISFILNLIIIIVIAVGASMFVKTFIMKSFYIPTESMTPTLEINDNVLVSRLYPNFMPIQRGDIVVFKDSQNWMNTPPIKKEATFLENISNFIILSEPADNQFLIKRIIGVPGDVVTCCDVNGRLTINDKIIKEPYLPGDVQPSEIDFSVTVPKGKVWVMGDNRDNSSDSRYHQDVNGGFINQEDIVGKAFYRLFPFDRMSGL